jgi:hypothetical protein
MITSVRALSVVVGSAALGGAYRAYLLDTPFPPDLVRVVPLLWLAGSVAGWILGYRRFNSTPASSPP